MKPAPFAYVRARTVDDAVAWLARDGDAKILAGGQSLVPMMNMRLARPTRVVDINGIDALGAITETPGHVVIGALVRHTELVTSPLLRARVPLLCAAAAHIGHRAIRNRGTLGGSLAHADPAAELPAALLALEATIVAAGPRGERRIAADEFFRGLFATALAPDEIVVTIEVPDGAAAWGFAEVARRAGDFAIAGVAGVVGADGTARLAAFGVDDRAVRLRSVEAALAQDAGAAAGGRERIARAAELAARDCTPADDVHGSADYRRHLVSVMTERVLEQCHSRFAAPWTTTTASATDAPGTASATNAASSSAAAGVVSGERVPARLVVNGRMIEREVSSRRSLADFLREDLGLTGTHVGCEHGVCGACTVLVDGRAARSCLLFAAQCDGAAVRTIEGLTPADGLSPLQAAFRDCHGLQCGFCTPGMIVTAHELLEETPAPTADQIREAIGGNLCMCTGYVNIVRAIQDAARRLGDGAR